MQFTDRFYKMVPKDYEGNLRWRAALHRLVLEDPSAAHWLYAACAQDILFYINSFVWTIDTRSDLFSKLPFITYRRQDDCIHAIRDAMYGNKQKMMKPHDMRIEKSRDTGATWMCSISFEHCWHFSETERHLLMVSRNKDYVDKRDNPKALFWKLDYLLANLPSWLLPPGYDPELHRKSCQFHNPCNGSMLDGEATTPNIARGDRRFAIFVDEFQLFRKSRSVMMATQRATNCRIFNGTPGGINNAFYDTKQMPMENFTYHWRDDPRKSIGRYTTDKDGKLLILDKEGYPDGYKPILDGKERSIAYDADEARSTSPREMAQEWDINYLGSGGQFFDPAKLDIVRRQNTRPAIFLGNLLYDPLSGVPEGFQETSHGQLQLWCNLMDGQKPDQSLPYVMGIDISAGTGASNSCLSVWRRDTQEKVAEYANPFMKPEPFATMGVALARWFNDAMMIWEFLGVGQSFGQRVLDLRYRNIYYRRKEESVSRKMSDVPGWMPSKTNKLQLLGSYRAALQDGVAINRSMQAMRECEEYIFTNDGGVAHAKSTDNEDPSGAKDNHGDRVIADALGWKLVSDRRANPSTESNSRIVEVGSLAWRRQQHERKQNQRKGRELPAGW